jgi:trimeric autotransporter adhesin
MMPSIMPSGPEALVNTVVSGNQISPVVAALSGGRYIVVWVGAVLPGGLTNANYAGADIRAQIFNADGTKSGGEFVVNPSTAGPQFAPVVTELSDGHILIAWQYNIGSLTNPASTGAAITLAQEFTSTGAAIGPEFQIGGGAEAIGAAITSLAGGGFFAAWQQGRGGNVVGQIYNSANAVVGGQLVIDNTDVYLFAPPLLATLANGNVVAAWSAVSGFNVRIYNPSGQPQTPEQNYYGAIENIVALTGGGFAVTTQTLRNYYALAVDLVVFGQDGAYVDDSRIWTYDNYNYNPNLAVGHARIAPLPNGGLIATWIGHSQPDAPLQATGDIDVFVQAYSASGTRIGQRYTINTTVAGDQSSPALASFANGNTIVVWRDESMSGQDTDGSAIRTRLVSYDPTPNAPIASPFTIYVGQALQGDTLTYSASDIATTFEPYVFDADGDRISLTAISNVVNGTATLSPTGDVTLQTAIGATGALSFDYTISDGNGGYATSQARVVLPNDFYVIRGASDIILNVLQNDFLLARTDGYQLNSSFNSSAGIPIGIVQNNELSQLYYYPALAGAFSDYYIYLPVGTWTYDTFGYSVTNPVTRQPDLGATVFIQLQGWAQIGGTGFDALGGSLEADHLVGGSGAANELVGGAGDDWYTSSAIGDTIVELPNEGVDRVRARGLSSFALPANVEELEAIEATSGFVGIGNSLGNLIIGTPFADALNGGAGDDFLRGGTGVANELVGGTGNDIFVVLVAGDTIVEYANEGIDTILTNLAAYMLPANVENLIFIGTRSFQGAGNGLDNVIVSDAAAASTLVGLGGNDTYVVRNAGDTIVEALGGGTDTVQTALSIYTLNAANVENLTYTGTGNFTGIGNAGNNAISGGAGADYLFAGAGSDTLTGGAGADVFLFDAAVNGIDAITDFTGGSDRLFFNQSVFTHTPTFALVQGAGAQVATTANSTFLFNSATGMLSYDADGTGAGAAVDIAMLSTGLTLTTADFVFYG